MTKQADGSWTFALNTALVKNGPRSLHAQLQYAGGDRDTPPLEVTYANPIGFGNVNTSGDRVYPNSGGQDLYSMFLWATQPGTATTEVRDVEGTVLRTITGDAEKMIYFDGRDDAGAALPSGSYRLVVRLDEPLVPSTATRTFNVLVNASRAGTVRSPVKGQTVEGQLRVEMTPEPGTAVGPPWTASVRPPGALTGQDIGQLTQQTDGSWAGDFDVNGFRLGQHELVVRGTSSDWSAATGAPAVPFTLAKKRLIGTTVLAAAGSARTATATRTGCTPRTPWRARRPSSARCCDRRHDRVRADDVAGDWTGTTPGRGTARPTGRRSRRAATRCACAPPPPTARPRSRPSALGVMGTPGT
jgi:hypothetical protein